MTRTKIITGGRRLRHKVPRYRPKKMKLSEIINKITPSLPPRVIHVQDPYYDQLLLGEKIVEARPYYPCFQDLKPGLMALRFIRVEEENPKNDSLRWERIHYDKKSLCSILETIGRVRRERMFPLNKKR